LATRTAGQIDINSQVRQVNEARSNDVWVSQTAVIEEWGLGEEDLWARLVDRHNELLHTGGIPAILWQQIESGLFCTCDKNETGQGKSRCAVCNGVGFVGGYEKFGFSTIFIAANTPDLVLNDLVIVKDNPWQLEIAPGKKTGTALSAVYQVTQNFGFTGTLVSGQDSIRAPLTQNGIKVEYTVNGGTDWFLISDTTALSEPALNVQFRITISRNSEKDKSPFFQILRARFQMQMETNVLVSKRSFPEQRWLETFGVRVKLDGVTWWTTPNLGIVGQKAVLVQEDDLFEILDGAYKSQSKDEEEFPVSGRFKPTNVTYVEPRGRFLSQRFNIRMLQRDEPELAVF
jgi:hypothetical protein